jgi:hypothetical protein
MAQRSAVRWSIECRGSRYHNMKELRPPSSQSSEIRMLSDAVSLRSGPGGDFPGAGDKAGNWERWYRKAIPIADERFHRAPDRFEGAGAMSRAGGSARAPRSLRPRAPARRDAQGGRRHPSCARRDPRRVQARISKIEHGEVSGIDIVRAYVAALGGTVDLVATVGDRTWKVA